MTQPLPVLQRTNPDDAAVLLRHAQRCADATQRALARYIQASHEPSDDAVRSWHASRETATLTRELTPAN